MSLKQDSEFPLPLGIAEKTLKQFSDEEIVFLKPKSEVIGLEAVIKFHKNPKVKQAKKNPFISWTLNKVTVIDHTWLAAQGDNIPINDRDWWRVKIEHETSPGLPVGCFTVRPLWKVEREDLVLLVPNFWEMTQKGLTVILNPKVKPWMNWVIHKSLRRMIMNHTGGSALVIPVSYPPDGPPQEALGTLHEALLGSQVYDKLLNDTVDDILDLSID